MKDNDPIALEMAIENLYTVFSGYKAPSSVVRFKCTSCFDASDENYLLTRPLRGLNDNVFGLLFESCNTNPFGEEAYKYFVPRILELTTIENPQFSFSFVEYVHQSFARFEYRNTFSALEAKAIDGFFKSWLWLELNKPQDEYDEAEIFYAAEAGYDSVSFLDNTDVDEISPYLFKDLKVYVDIQKQHKSKDEFKKWASTGAVKQLVLRVYGEDER